MIDKKKILKKVSLKKLTDKVVDSKSFKKSRVLQKKQWILKKKKPYHLAFFYKRPWWWKSKLGIWWIQRNKYFLKWKKYKKWYQLINLLKLQNFDQIRSLKLKSRYKYKLLLKHALKKIYGNISSKLLKKKVDLAKKKKTFADKHLIFSLENRLDVFVSRLSCVRNINQSQELIKQGLILVNGKVIYSNHFLLKETDVISIDNYYLKFIKYCFKGSKRKLPQTQTRHINYLTWAEGLVYNSNQNNIFFLKFFKQNIFKNIIRG